MRPVKERAPAVLEELANRVRRQQQRGRITDKDAKKLLGLIREMLSVVSSMVELDEQTELVEVRNPD